MIFLIKLSQEHYILIDDSEIVKNDYCYDLETKSIRQWVGDEDSWIELRKITHSTEPIEEVPFGFGKVFYKIERLSLQGVKKLIGEADAGKKYNKKEVFELMCKAFEQGFKKADVVESGLESKETDVECAWILKKHNSTIKTEWEVEIDDSGKFKLKDI